MKPIQFRSKEIGTSENDQIKIRHTVVLYCSVTLFSVLVEAPIDDVHDGCLLRAKLRPASTPVVSVEPRAKPIALISLTSAQLSVSSGIELPWLSSVSTGTVAENDAPRELSTGDAIIA